MNDQKNFYAVSAVNISSACSTLLAAKIGGGSTMLKQKNRFLFGIVFTLHYLCQLELCLRA